MSFYEIAKAIYLCRENRKAPLKSKFFYPIGFWRLKTQEKVIYTQLTESKIAFGIDNFL